MSDRLTPHLTHGALLRFLSMRGWVRVENPDTRVFRDRLAHDADVWQVWRPPTGVPGLSVGVPVAVHYQDYPRCITEAVGEVADVMGMCCARRAAGLIRGTDPAAAVLCEQIAALLPDAGDDGAGVPDGGVLEGLLRGLAAVLGVDWADGAGCGPVCAYVRDWSLHGRG
jgi:hypothetical protein